MRHHCPLMTVRPPTWKAHDIIREVALESGVSAGEIVGRRRLAWIVKARYEAIRRVRSELNYSTPQIGEVFNRDHATILYALNRLKRKPTV